MKRQMIPYLILHLVIGSLLGGCEPPDAELPSIEILYPEGATIELQHDCSLLIDIVVDIDNLEMVDPDSVTEAEMGQGHWHMDINGEPSESLWGSIVATYQGGADIFDVKDILRIETTLQDNEHNVMQGEDTRSAIELVIVEPAGGGCK